MFYANIHCGLMIISYEKQILNNAFAKTAAVAMVISFIPSLTAAFNALGRIGYSTLSDKMEERNNVYYIVFVTSCGMTVIALCTGAITGTTKVPFLFLAVLFLLVINAGYGGGFSTLPALLSERFGMTRISQIHGLALSAWAIAGLTGNNTSEIILKTSGNYNHILVCCSVLYAIAFLICNYGVKSRKDW